MSVGRLALSLIFISLVPIWTRFYQLAFISRFFRHFIFVGNSLVVTGHGAIIYQFTSAFPAFVLFRFHTNIFAVSLAVNYSSIAAIALSVRFYRTPEYSLTYL